MLDSLCPSGFFRGYRSEIVGAEDPAGPAHTSGTSDRSPRRGFDDLVQPIVVGPAGGHFEIIEAVMRASATAYLERDDDPAWAQWLAGSFTKTVRFTNATRLGALAEGPGSTVVTVGDATAVAFAPMRPSQMPKRIARARVSGLDRPRPDTNPPLAGYSVLVNDSLDMTTGKSAAQAAHAVMVQVLSGVWDAEAVAAARAVPVSHGLLDVFAHLAPEDVIHDAGWTEIPSGSTTALALHIEPELLPRDQHLHTIGDPHAA